jgi:hypothetical protein
MDESKEVSLIADAFRFRDKPSVLFESRELADFEIEDVKWLEGRRWQDLDGDGLEDHRDVVAWLTPDAFCCYLPGFMSTGIRENAPTLLVNETILMLLDHASPPDDWDDFSVVRWRLLKKEECAAVESWLWWLVKSGEYEGESDRLERALASIDAVKQEQADAASPSQEKRSGDLDLGSAEEQKE